MKTLPFSTINAITKLAIGDIADERTIQQSQKNHTTADDDKLVENELIRAGVAYAMSASRDSEGNRSAPTSLIHDVWPWSKESYKEHDRRRSLVIAAALLVAEIERIDRANQLEKD